VSVTLTSHHSLLKPFRVTAGSVALNDIPLFRESMSKPLMLTDFNYYFVLIRHNKEGTGVSHPPLRFVDTDLS